MQELGGLFSLFENYTENEINENFPILSKFVKVVKDIENKKYITEADFQDITEKDLDYIGSPYFDIVYDHIFNKDIKKRYHPYYYYFNRGAHLYDSMFFYFKKGLKFFRHNQFPPLKLVHDERKETFSYYNNQYALYESDMGVFILNLSGWAFVTDVPEECYIFLCIRADHMEEDIIRLKDFAIKFCFDNKKENPPLSLRLTIENEMPETLPKKYKDKNYIWISVSVYPYENGEKCECPENYKSICRVIYEKLKK